MDHDADDDSLQQKIIDTIDNKRNLRMTDLGFSLSQVVSSELEHRRNAQRDTTHTDSDSDEYLQQALQMGRRRRTGVRGRPKQPDHGFGRASTTHRLHPSAARLMGAANQAFVGRQYGRAEELLLQVVREAPSSPEPYHTLAMMCEEKGETERAAGLYMVAALLQQSNVELWLKLADWAEKGISVSGSVDRDTREDAATTTTAAAIARREEEAIFCLGRALGAINADDDRLKSHDVEELFWKRARLLLSVGQPKEAVRSFSKLLIARLDDIGLVKRIAKLAISQGIPVAAADVLERAARKSTALAVLSTSAWSVVNLILELLMMSEGGEREHGRIVRLSKEYARRLADHSLLLSLPHWGAWTAEEQDEWLVKQMPTEIYIKYAIAYVYCHHAAEEEEKDDNDGDSVMAMMSADDVIPAEGGARGSNNTGDSCSAQAHLDVGKLIPSEEGLFGELLAAFVDACMATRQHSLALPVLHWLQSSDQTWSPQNCALLGHCLLQLGQLDAAVDSYRACLVADPGCEEARLALATIYQQMGNRAGLVEILETGRLYKRHEQAKKRGGTRKRASGATDSDDNESLYSSSSGSSDEVSQDKDTMLHMTKRGTLRQRSVSSRIEFSAPECTENKQEYRRILLALDAAAGHRRELFIDTLSSAHSLIQRGLLHNPNIMMTNNKKAKWLLSVDWERDAQVLKGVLLSEWINLLLKYCSVISEQLGQAAQAQSLLSNLFHNSMLFKVAGPLDAIRLRVALCEIADMTGNHPLLLQSVRQLIRDHASNRQLLLWMYGKVLREGVRGKACILSSIPFGRFLNRLLMSLEGPARDNMLVLHGHMYAMNGSWEEALRTYLQASASAGASSGDDPVHDACNNQSILTLCLGVAYYHRALQRTCSSQKWYFAKALACFDDLWTTSPTDSDPCMQSLADYNKARCFHGLGLLDGACRYYLRVLDSSSGGSTGSLQRIAAYNLALICAGRNNPDAARELLKTYCTLTTAA